MISAVKLEGVAAEAESLAGGPGLLQGFDPRVKVVAVLALVTAATLTSSLAAIAALFVLAVLLAVSSAIPLARLAKQVWFGVLLFTGAIALPALFVVPGDPVAHVAFITVQGARSAAVLIARAETSATFAALLILTTRWPHVLKALSALGVPAAAVAVLGMTHRYIFVLLRAASDLAEARRSRMLAPMNGRARRHLLITSLGALLSKSMALSTDIHMAMVARGFRGEVRLLDEFQTRPRDWLALAAAFAVPAVVLVWRA